MPDSDSFYKRYFRKPENYNELTSWVSNFCFRTLKSQVTNYVNFIRRLPFTIDYPLTDKETQLYEKIDHYLKLPIRYAYPKMETYELTMMFYHTVSSSAQALAYMLSGDYNQCYKHQSDRL